jgi:hypothetical protein
VPATGGPAPAGRGDSSRAAGDRSGGATTTDPAGSAEIEAHPATFTTPLQPTTFS